MTFGVPNFGMHFKWKEPLAVRHAVAPDPWHTSSTISKLIRAAMAAAPFLLLIALAPMLRPKSSPPIGPMAGWALAGMAVLLGLIVGFGVPLANHYTRRTIRIGQDKIMVQSGVKPRASKWQMPIIDSHDREFIVAVHFERRQFKAREHNIMRIRLRWGEEIIIGIAPKESADEVRTHMRQWGYCVT